MGNGWGHRVDALINGIHCLDFFGLRACIGDASIDLIFADFPYGTTRAKSSLSGGCGEN